MRQIGIEGPRQVEATLAAEEEDRARVEVAEAAEFDRVSGRGMPSDSESDSESQEF